MNPSHQLPLARVSRFTFHVSRFTQHAPDGSTHQVLSTDRHQSGLAFTLLEIMIAITILALILTAIFSSWTAILRASKSGLDVAAAVQRSRIALRTLEDSLGSAQCFMQNQRYYGFVAENGDEATLSFVARLSKSFPRGGKFGDLDVRRLTFSVEPGNDGSRDLVLRQTPLLMEFDIDEMEHPLVLAKNVKAFELEFWDQRQNDWTDEWLQTNQLPRLVKLTLKLADNAQSTQPQEEITRIVSLAANAVQPGWQMPRGGPGQPLPPGATNQPPRGSQGADPRRGSLRQP
jgi:type II secretory pathway pseudopilin PulG